MRDDRDPTCMNNFRRDCYKKKPSWPCALPGQLARVFFLTQDSGKFLLQNEDFCKRHRIQQQLPYWKKLANETHRHLMYRRLPSMTSMRSSMSQSSRKSTSALWILYSCAITCVRAPLYITSNETISRQHDWPRSARMHMGSQLQIPCSSFTA